MADDVIYYTEYDVAGHALALTDGRGVDLILGGVGGEAFRANLRAAVPGGRVIVYGVAAGEAFVTNGELVFEFRQRGRGRRRGRGRTRPGRSPAVR
jgi:NADPH2:quinone reductase